ncbi:MAG: BMP family protein [Ilumatobacteraceae bacterium]
MTQLSHRTSRRKLILGATATSVALLAAACGSDSNSDAADTTQAAAETTAAPAPESSAAADDSAMTDDSAADSGAAMTGGGEFKVALVSPSATNDLAFSQSMADALNVIKGEYGDGFQIDYSDGMFVVEDAAAAIRDYASQGYDLVICHGTQYGGSLQEIAPDFPDVSFAWGTAVDTFGLDNVFAYTSAADEGGYILGAMAAALTSDTIGVVGPIEAGDAKLYIDGFLAGAAAGGNTDVPVTYTGSFSDVSLAAEAADAFISSGVGAMTGTAQMVVGAVNKAAAAGVPWFGTQADQTQLGPDVVVASQVYHWEVILRDMIAAIQSGQLGGESFAINFANDGLGIAYNDGYALDPAIKAIGDDTAAKMRRARSPPGSPDDVALHAGESPSDSRAWSPTRGWISPSNGARSTPSSARTVPANRR